MTILHTNDTHSYLDNFDKCKHFVDTQRLQYENVLLVDSGDMLRGGLYYSVFHGEKEPYLINALQYDYMTLGNHDFDNGSKDVFKFLSQVNSQVVVSNVQWDKDKYLNKLTNYSPYTIHTFADGTTVGIIGLLTPTTQTSSSPSKHVVFLDPIACAKEIVLRLKEQVDVIVVLSHLGDDEDVKLAQTVSGIHYIIGSHTHKVLEQPITIVNEENWETHITQAGSYGNYIGQIDVAIEKDKVCLQNYQLVDLREYAFYDEALHELLNTWRVTIEQTIAKPIATAKEDLIGKRDVTKLQSTNLTNLVTDAYFKAAVDLGFQPDIAIMNSGGIRQTIPQGVITYGNVLQVLPFACELYVCQITGHDLFTALDYGEYPQISGGQLTYVWQDDVLRLKTVTIQTENGYEPLDLEKTYVVATNSFIGNGKDEYFGFKNTKNLVQQSLFDTDILMAYLQQLEQPIRYTTEIRKLVE